MYLTIKIMHTCFIYFIHSLLGFITHQTGKYYRGTCTTHTHMPNTHFLISLLVNQPTTPPTEDIRPTRVNNVLCCQDLTDYLFQRLVPIHVLSFQGSNTEAIPL